jgi:type I restriction enzyme, S subunit
LEKIRRFPILVPTLQEQHKIASALSTWDAAMAAESKLIAALQVRYHALMQRLLTGRLRLRGFEREWKQVRLGEVFQERNDIGRGDLPLLSIGSAGVTYQADSTKKDTSNEDKSKHRRICPGDIGYNTMRMWQGRSALSSLEGIVSPAYTIVTPKARQHAPFYALLFKQPHVVNRFYCHSQGLVDDTLNCKYKDFSLVKVLIPDYEEQCAIATILSIAENEIGIHRRHLTALQIQKKGLMQMLLTGKKRVTI